MPAVASSSVDYVVKEGDNLHKIAREQCGSTSFVSQIQEMNKDLLKGSDKLKISMKLKLPPKPMMFQGSTSAPHSMPRCSNFSISGSVRATESVSLYS